METLEFTFSSKPARTADPVLCGVVGSGNLEVLVKATPGITDCEVRVATSVGGFADAWRAALEEFAAKHAAGATQIIINDMGATPAVVMLRLQQALAAYSGDAA